MMNADPDEPRAICWVQLSVAEPPTPAQLSPEPPPTQFNWMVEPIRTRVESAVMDTETGTTVTEVWVLADCGLVPQVIE